MGERKTINDVYTAVARIEERQINLVDNFNKSENKDILWKEGHEKKDDAQHLLINKRIDSLKNYLRDVSLVSGTIGAIGVIVLKKLGWI